MSRFMTRFVCVLLVIAVAGTPLFARTWKDRKGREVEADFLGFAEGKVTIKRHSDGRTFVIPMESLSDADQSFVKSQPKPSVPARTTKADPSAKAGNSAAWRISWAKILRRDIMLPEQFRDARAYSETYGGNKWYLLKQDSDQFVVVGFGLTPVTEDPQAVEKLVEKRRKLADAISTKSLAGDISRPHVPVNAERKAGLVGRYRLMDLDDVRVVDPSGKNVMLHWAMFPETAVSLFGPLSDLEGNEIGRPDPKGTAATIRAYHTLLGLVEVGKEVTVNLLTVLPKGQSLDGFRLTVEGCDPVVLKHIEKLDVEKSPGPAETKPASKGETQPPKSAQPTHELPAKGGTNWSSSAKLATFGGSEKTEGARLWIWPPKDEVIVLKQSDPRFTLAWRMRRGQPPLAAKDIETIWTEIRGKTPGTAFGLGGAIKGWREGESEGQVEIIPGPAIKDYRGDGELLVYFGYKGEVFSNFLSLKVRIEE